MSLIKMQKILVPILAASILIAAGGGYYFGLKQGVDQGRADLQKELQVKEEIYKRSKEAVRDAVQKYFGAFKFGDFKEVYALQCQEPKQKVDESTFIKPFEEWAADLRRRNFVVRDFTLEDILLNGDIAKVRFTETRESTLLSRKIELPQQLQFRFENGGWCLESF